MADENTSPLSEAQKLVEQALLHEELRAHGNEYTDQKVTPPKEIQTTASAEVRNTIERGRMNDDLNAYGNNYPGQGR